LIFLLAEDREHAGPPRAGIPCLAQRCCRRFDVPLRALGAAAHRPGAAVSAHLARVDGYPIVRSYPHDLSRFRSAFSEDAHMNIQLSLAPLIALLAGILILVQPKLLNYIVAIYLIIIGILGLVGRSGMQLN
jgi:hypothetical protein